MLNNENKCESLSEEVSAKLMFEIVDKNEASAIYIDSKAKDYNGLKLVANSFTKDVELVTGIKPSVVTEINELSKVVIIAGSIGNNEIIDSLILRGSINVNEINNKRECYKIDVIEKPLEGIEKALVIVGSDKRGTIYGIYHISELIGVSPWVYFADVKPIRREKLIFSQEELSITTKEPSVKYRGFFLNDEWPSLGSWVTNTFGDFNEEFYDKVFQLLLRLKANFMWPAMWSSVFSENGKSDPLANAKLADKYGIVIGTSHHESMFRAGEEWKNIYKQYGQNGKWDFASNGEAINKFWEDGVKRNKDFESLITIGMRGEQDSALVGSEEENIELLKKIINSQKDILKNQNLEEAQQVLTIYKEVEKYWYGNEKTTGLRNWDKLDDVTIMMADDNFGNVRTLPSKEEKNRKAGWGLYYHFDYHGGPISYEWVNTTPLEKVWEQMTMAYDYGIHDIWIVNVGDLKPMELPISYFLDLAYDFDTWGTNSINKINEYTNKWVNQQFSGLQVEEKKLITDILASYTKISGSKKPEVTYTFTYSLVNNNEAENMLDRLIELEAKAEKCYKNISTEYKDAYYQLVYYPSVATANVIKMQIYAALNNFYYEEKSSLANKYYDLVEKCKVRDIELQNYYNNEMTEGKWKGIMSSPHIGYRKWSPDGWTYPETFKLDLINTSKMIVNVQGDEKAYTTGEIEMQPFTNLGAEEYSIIISNQGKEEFSYQAKASTSWIKLDKVEGIVGDGVRLIASINWNEVNSDSNGIVTIIGAGQEVDIKVLAKVIDTKELPEMTFVENHNVISIEAEHALRNVAKNNIEWKVIDNYGRSLSSIKMFPTDVSFIDIKDAPYMEYLLKVNEEAEYTLIVYSAPSNNLSINTRLKYAVSFDDDKAIIADSLANDYVAGDYFNNEWCKGVLDNIHLSTTKHKLTKGVHTLRLYGLDAGLVVQKLVLSRKKLPKSFFGPKESYYVLKNE